MVARDIQLAQSKALYEMVISGTTISNVDKIIRIFEDEIIYDFPELQEKLVSKYVLQIKSDDVILWLETKAPELEKQQVFISNYRTILLGDYTQFAMRKYGIISEIQRGSRRKKLGKIMSSIWHKIDVRDYPFVDQKIIKKNVIDLDTIETEVAYKHGKKWYDPKDSIAIVSKIAHPELKKDITLNKLPMVFHKKFDAEPLFHKLEEIIENAEQVTLDEIAKYYDRAIKGESQGISLKRGIFG